MRQFDRREFLLGAAAIAAVGQSACEPHAPTTHGAKEKEQSMQREERATMDQKMPAIFLPHGGGPWPFTHDPIVGDPKMYAQMLEYMQALNMTPPVKPRAILVVSAHWEEQLPTVMTGQNPPMLYDYYNFPPETYEVQWPAPGAPELAGEITELLRSSGFEFATNQKRGFDHGVFVPLKLAYPGAEIPTLQLSLVRGLDPKEHIAIGRALAPLRRKGVFIVGSGMSYHNLRALFTNMRAGTDRAGVKDSSKAFDEWMGESMLLEPDLRETRLVEWAKAPQARAAHPREEHLLPLHVIAGAAEDDIATLPYRDVVMGAHISAVHFG